MEPTAELPSEESSYHSSLPTQAEAVIQKARAIMQLPSMGTMATQLNLNSEQRELLEQFEKSLAGNSKHSPRTNNWFDGVKKFFDNLTG